MKRLILLTLMIVISVSVNAQKRYDEIEYPPLNNFEKTKVEEYKLKNGITFFLVEDHELPLVRLSATIRTGSLLEPTDKIGLAGMVGEVMREGGSDKYPADKLNILLEDRAATMSTYIGENSGSASMSILKEDLDELLPVFVDLLVNPAFPEDKIELSKTQSKSSISRRNDEQAQIAGREFFKLIYGENSPYTTQTEYETIDAIARQDLVDFHKQSFVGNNMMIGVIGDFKTKDMKKKLKNAFEKIPAGTKTDINYPEVQYDFPSTINFVDKTDVNQSFILIGHIGGLRDNPDYAALQMMNEVLSGGFAGRLFQKVRSDLGLAYSVSGNYNSGIHYPGVFNLITMTKSATTAQSIDAILVEVKKMQDEPILQKELDDARDRFLNSLVFKYDSKSKILNERISNEYNGLPEDLFDQYVEEIKNVNIADIQRVAQEYLRPDQVQILVVGNSNEIGDQLDKYGDINTIDITIPMPASDEETVSGDAAQGEEWLTKMAQAIVEPGTEITELSTSLSLTQTTPMGDMTMESSSTINFEEVSANTIIESPQGTITTKLENGAATMAMMGQEQELPPQMVGPMIKEIKNNYVNIALNYASLDAEFMGTEQLDGKELIVLKVKSEGEITFLIDPDTNLPLYSRTTEFEPQSGANITAVNKYSDWQETDGLNYAFETETSADGEVVASTKTKSVEIK